MPMEEIPKNNNEKQKFIIGKERYNGLSRDAIANSLFGIYKDTFGLNLKDGIEKDKVFDNNDIIKVSDSIALINSLQEKVANPPEKELKIEIECKLSEFFEQYQKLLQEKIKELNLDQDQTYNIYSWFHNEDIYDKKEKDINKETIFKNMNFDGYVIEEGKSRF